MAKIKGCLLGLVFVIAAASAAPLGVRPGMSWKSACFCGGGING